MSAMVTKSETCEARPVRVWRTSILDRTACVGVFLCIVANGFFALSQSDYGFGDLVFWVSFGGVGVGFLWAGFRPRLVLTHRGVRAINIFRSWCLPLASIVEVEAEDAWSGLSFVTMDGTVKRSFLPQSSRLFFFLGRAPSQAAAELIMEAAEQARGADARGDAM